MRPINDPFTTWRHGLSAGSLARALARSRTRRASARCLASRPCARFRAAAWRVSARSTAFTYLFSSARLGPEQPFATPPRRYRRCSLARSPPRRDFFRYASIELTLFTRTKRFDLGRGRFFTAIAAIASSPASAEYSVRPSGASASATGCAPAPPPWATEVTFDSARARVSIWTTWSRFVTATYMRSWKGSERIPSGCALAPPTETLPMTVPDWRYTADTVPSYSFVTHAVCPSREMATPNG